MADRRRERDLKAFDLLYRGCVHGIADSLARVHMIYLEFGVHPW